MAELMREHGIRSKAVRRFVPRTTESRHDRPVADNVLAREFYPDRPDTARAADITYVPTAQGWIYPAAVIDMCSREVVGWATADHLRAELPLEALRMAPTHRKPAGGLQHHSDRGVQSASGAYRALPAAHGIEPRMSRSGNCRDNAVVESFFSTQSGNWSAARPTPTTTRRGGPCSSTPGRSPTRCAATRRRATAAPPSSRPV